MPRRVFALNNGLNCSDHRVGRSVAAPGRILLCAPKFRARFDTSATASRSAGDIALLHRRIGDNTSLEDSKVPWYPANRLYSRGAAAHHGYAFDEEVVTWLK